MAIFGRKVMNNRITILGIVVLFLLSLDVARIFYLQVLKGDEYAAKAESQQLSDTEIPASAHAASTAFASASSEPLTVPNSTAW